MLVLLLLVTVQGHSTNINEMLDWCNNAETCNSGPCVYCGETCVHHQCFNNATTWCNVTLAAVNYCHDMVIGYAVSVCLLLVLSLALCVTVFCCLHEHEKKYTQQKDVVK